jgi:hypothetical protein
MAGIVVVYPFKDPWVKSRRTVGVFLVVKRYLPAAFTEFCWSRI